jgi:hypothetical protein
MKKKVVGQGVLGLALGVAVAVATGGNAEATSPCGGFEECKAFIEINATDGDIGFQFFVDGEGLRRVRLRHQLKRLFAAETLDGLEEQRLGEISVESDEPSCEDTTLEEFLLRFPARTYIFTGRVDDIRGVVEGVTPLTHELPAAPTSLDFDVLTGVISWEAGTDLGECGTSAELGALVIGGALPVHPEEVEVDAWEIVLEPDVDESEPVSEQIFTVRVTGDIDPLEVTVPADYLASLPDDTPVKIEVGAIGGEHNATFSEEDGFCVNEVNGCE